VDFLQEGGDSDKGPAETHQATIKESTKEKNLHRHERRSRKNRDRKEEGKERVEHPSIEETRGGRGDVLAAWEEETANPHHRLKGGIEDGLLKKKKKENQERVPYLPEGCGVTSSRKKEDSEKAPRARNKKGDSRNSL